MSPTSFPTITPGEAWDTGPGQASTLMNQITGAINALETGAAINQFPYLGLGGNSYESFSRMFVSSTQGFAPATGTLFLTPVVLPAGFSVGHISFYATSGTTMATATHWWFGLWDSSRVQLAVTADQLTTLWGTDVLKTLAVATTGAGAASTFTTTYTGLYYAGVCQAATTRATVATLATAQTIMNSASPQMGSLSTTGLTAPPAFPSTASALSGVSLTPWCAVGN